MTIFRSFSDNEIDHGKIGQPIGVQPALLYNLSAESPQLYWASNLYESQSNAFALDLLLMRTTLSAARLINEMGLQNKFFQVYYSNTQLSD